MLQDSCIQSQPPCGCTALLSVLTSSLWDRYCLGNFSFCTEFLFLHWSQLTSSSLLVVCPTPSPTLLLSKMLLLLASVKQLVLRNQKSYNYSIPHSQLTAMPGTWRGLLGSEGGATGCDSRTPEFGFDCVACQALEHLFQVP